MKDDTGEEERVLASSGCGGGAGGMHVSLYRLDHINRKQGNQRALGVAVQCT